MDWVRGAHVDTNLSFLLCVATASGNAAGLLGVLHGARELGPISHVIVHMLTRALLGPPMGRAVSMAVAATHAVWWGGVGGGDWGLGWEKEIGR